MVPHRVWKRREWRKGDRGGCRDLCAEGREQGLHCCRGGGRVEAGDREHLLLLLLLLLHLLLQLLLQHLWETLLCLEEEVLEEERAEQLLGGAWTLCRGWLCKGPCGREQRWQKWMRIPNTFIAVVAVTAETAGSRDAVWNPRGAAPCAGGRCCL